MHSIFKRNFLIINWKNKIFKRNFLIINRKNKNSRNKKLKTSWLHLLLCETVVWLSYLFISRRVTLDFKKSGFHVNSLLRKYKFSKF